MAKKLFEHIVRNENDFNNIRIYSINTPIAWASKEENLTGINY